MKPFHVLSLRSTGAWVRRHWVGIVGVLLASLIFVAGAPAWAAAPASRVNQTVPNPTATPSDSPDPTATPRPRDSGSSNDDGDDNSDSSDNVAAPSQPDDPTTGLFAPQTGEESAAVALTGIVSVPAINVMQLPDPASTLLGTAYLNDTVTILSRNQDGSWWLICCASGTDRVGWVNSRLIAPNFDATQANALLPVDPSLTGGAVAAASAVTAEAGAAPDLDLAAMSSLQVQIEQHPPFVWQGQEFQLHYLITNPSDVEAQQVELSNEAPVGLEWSEAVAAGDATIRREPGNGGAALLVVSWPTLGAGETISATFTAQVAPDLENGAVIRNFVVVGGANAEDSSASIRIGMPPASLPDFK